MGVIPMDPTYRSSYFLSFSTAPVEKYYKGGRNTSKILIIIVTKREQPLFTLDTRESLQGFLEKKPSDARRRKAQCVKRLLQIARCLSMSVCYECRTCIRRLSPVHELIYARKYKVLPYFDVMPFQRAKGH